MIDPTDRKDDMSASDYRVQKIDLESYDSVAEGLESAITGLAQDGWEFVSCVSHPHHPDVGIRETSRTDSGEDPYDAIWQKPMGPTFYGVFRRSPKA
jgi:hypothetical protein